MSKPKPCPQCGHPMMEGPLRVKALNGGEAAWWCANCHHAIATKPTLKEPNG